MGPPAAQAARCTGRSCQAADPGFMKGKKEGQRRKKARWEGVCGKVKKGKGK